MFRKEAAAQLDRWKLWTPLAFGGGAAVYFALPAEPPLWAALTPALLLSALAAMSRRAAWSRAAVAATTLVALLACGFLAAEVRTVRVAAPVAPVLNGVTVEGWVIDVAAPGVGGGRAVIAPVRISGLAPEATPKRIRLTMPPDAVLGPGMGVRVRARLTPPPPPASPGAYDFARNAWFDGVGGVGYALSRPLAITLPEPSARLALTLRINAARWLLSRRIADEMSPASQGLGVAMITGHGAWLTDQTQSDLRDSGLAHIISISGVHMAIVGGFVFVLVRMAFALWPWAAVRVSGKKAAAAVGLAAVLVYLVVSGAPPPAERSAITAVVAFGAILADRRAISLHALALAALGILTVQPEAIVEPGFQMSFAATAALVALAEAWPRRSRAINAPWPIRLIQSAAAWLGISLAASFVAGLATGPFAMQDFNRTALYGLPANLLTEPLSSFVIMPALAVGAALAPLGLGKPFLFVAGKGIEVMILAAGWFAHMPHAVMTVASAPAVALPTAFVGLLWMCLWKGRLRWLGLPAALAVNLWPRPPAPDVWINAEGSAAAMREGRTAVLMRPDVKLFAATLWARRRGLAFPENPEAARDERFDCNRRRCLAKRPGAVAGWWSVKPPTEEVFRQLCSGAAVVVIRAEPPAGGAPCQALVLTGADFRRGGSAELYRVGTGWRIVWAQDLRGRRPWTAGPSDNGG
ncbi:competence protein ComEC [Caulobacter sp. CCUG 60055]|uniref:ComEC/Rec2 family competence protein n=1 Tax=Caulobacter sp. CCUG 60055 TaxID=2100090 RepID=UPI001FA72773|nr:competence protein ComEC [Caulobacter sp. CCUG 60055]